MLLQLICFQLVDQTDAPALLSHIQQNPPALSLNLFHGRIQLLSAVAAGGTKHIPGKALGMDTAKNIFPVADLAFYQRHMVLSRNIVDIAINLKIPVFRRQFSAGFLNHMIFMKTAVVLQILDGDKNESELFRHLPKLRCAHHGSVLCHYLTAKPAFLQPGQTHQIHSRFRMTAPLQYAALFGHQREHMSRPSEILRFGIVFHTFHRRNGAFRCGNSCCGIHVIDGHCKCRTVIVRILLHHLRKSQFLGKLSAHRHTDQPLRVGRHKIHIGLCGKLRRTDEISFIFPVRVIRYQYDFSFPKRLERFFYRIILHLLPP